MSEKKFCPFMRISGNIQLLLNAYLQNTQQISYSDIDNEACIGEHCQLWWFCKGKDE